MATVIIKIEGGVVQSVLSDVDEINVVVVDKDEIENIKDEVDTEIERIEDLPGYGWMSPTCEASSVLDELQGIS